MTVCPNVTTRFSNDGSNTVEIELSRDIDDQSVSRNIALAGVTSVEMLDSRKVRIHLSVVFQNPGKTSPGPATMKIA